MLSVVTILAITLSTYLLCKFFFGRMMGRNKTPVPPGPAPWPIIGCLPQMLSAASKYKWIKRAMKDLNTEILCIRVANVHVILVFGQKYASEFLKQKDVLFASRPLSLGASVMSHNYMGVVFSPCGNQWTKMRKILSSQLLSPAMHKMFLDKRREEVDNIVEYITNLPDGIVDFRKTTLYYSTSVIKRLIFNTRYFGEAMADKGPGPAEEDHTENVLKALVYLFTFALSDFIPILTGLDLDGKEKKVLDAIKSMEKYQNPITDERLRKWRTGSVSSNEDMLDVMINLKNSDGQPLLSEAEIKGLVNELILGATDNVANCVEWAVGEMLNQPSIMRKAMDELDRVVGKDRVVEESDISELKYIKAILMEAFRLHPIQAFIPPHFATEDATVGGYFIPKGSHILISRLDLGRNPNVWDNPLTFDPDRHMSNGGVLGSTITDPDLGFLSFGVGRRVCPAGTLGTVMTVMLLARLLQAFDWSLPPGTDKVDLNTCDGSMLFMASPLLARAAPRLPFHLY